MAIDVGDDNCLEGGAMIAGWRGASGGSERMTGKKNLQINLPGSR